MSYDWLSSALPAWMQPNAITGGAADAQGQTTQPMNSAGTTMFDPSGNLNFSSLDPSTMQALQAAGWTGGNPIQTNTGAGLGAAVQNGVTQTPDTQSFSPQFQSWMQQNGINPSITAGAGDANTQNLGFYNGSSTSPTTGQIGDTNSVSMGSDTGMGNLMMAMIGGAGFAAAGGLGAAGADTAGSLAPSLSGAAADDAALTGVGSNVGSLGDIASGVGSAAGASGQTLTDSQMALGDTMGGNSLGAGGANTAAQQAALDSSFSGGSGTALGNGLAPVTSVGLPGSTASAGGINASSLGLAAPTAASGGAGGIGSLLSGLGGNGTADALLASSAIGGLGSLAAGSIQANAQDNATALQQGMFNTITGQEQPFMNAGYGATADINQLLGNAPTTGPGGTAGGTGLPGGYLTQQFNPTQDQLNSYPGYQFQLATGGQAVTNAATPQSGALSGSTLKNLMNFNQGTAASNYNQYFNQFQTQQNNIYSRLSGIAGMGQNAASNTGTAGTALGTGAAQSTAAAGGSLAGGVVGATNSASSGSIPLAYLMMNQTPTQASGP